MKNLALQVSLATLMLSPLIFTTGCSKSSSSDSDLIGNWSLVSEIPGAGRSEAVCFVVNNEAYIGTGLFDNYSSYNNAFYKYVIDKGWTNVTPNPDSLFSAEIRQGAVGFSVGGFGYVATGYNGRDNKYFSDVWRYNPVSKGWKQMNDFPGGARRNAVAFTIGDRAFIATGYNSGGALLDLWEYNIASDSWTQRQPLTRKRSQSQVFVMGGKAYVVSGNNNGDALTDLQMYDPVADSWTEKRKIINANTSETYDDKYSNIARYGGVAFVMNDKGYVATGRAGGLITDTWEYDAVNDLWTKKTSFEGSAREGAVAFVINNRGFVLTGRSGSTPFDNMFEWHPNDPKNDNDNN